MRQSLLYHRAGHRRGIAIMALVVALAVLSVMVSATTWQIVAQRRTLERRFNQEQAAWLARAGIERAAGRLLAGPAGNREDTMELIPRSELRVAVRREPGKGDTFYIASESRFPTDAPHAVVRLETRRFRRVVEDGRTRITVIPAGVGQQEATP